MALTKVKAGNILLTTPGASSNDVTPATTQYVTTALANLADSAPSTLNTLNELAAALGDDANFRTTVTNSIAAKLPLAGGTMTGQLNIVDSSTTFGSIITNNNDGSQGLQVRTSDNDSGLYILDLQTSSSATGTNYASVFNVAKSGYVGIGAAPSGNFKLLLQGTDSQEGLMIHAGASASQWLIRAEDNAGNQRFVVKSTGDSYFNGGNLGIGTTSPTQKLDVNGTVELNNLTVAGAQGSDGQVLTSTGSGVAWEAASGGATSLNGLSDATVTGSNPAVNTNPSTGVGTLWINSSSGQSYVCTSATSNNNVWTNITEGANVEATLDVDYVVIAGGGAGGRGNSAAGGGGAGGYRSSFNSETSGGGASSETRLQLTAGTVYTITVGAGGAQSTIAGNHIGNSGAASSITGSDITDITTVGGGGGAASTGNALGGGSGGGGAWTAKTGGAGTANQGFKGGDAFAASNQWSGAGGGGAGAAGANVSVGSNNSPTDGGVGVASTITGSSIYRAGGGGGCADAGTGSSGGNGGGGDGGGSGNPVQAGTANTGGGGGAGPSTTPGAGGSGVVILRMFTSIYSGTTAGSPTVTQSGNQTILTYTSSGTYTG